MPCRGVLYAITNIEAEQLLRLLGRDSELVETVHHFYTDDRAALGFLAPLDKAWHAIHLCLTNGDETVGSGTTTLSLCILGSLNLYEGDEFIVCLVPAKSMPEIVEALDKVTKEWFYSQYDQFVPHEFDAAYHMQDREYSWYYFQAVRKLYRSAASGGRCAVFYVDQ